jgi:starch-binding outer membrane protein, SusD/RagB family
MRTLSRKPLVVGTAFLVAAGATLYGCKDFLTDAANSQGTLDEKTLANRAGVEGTLVGAYRALDCTASLQPNWGCAASNWVWGSVAADESYKGSNGTDQPPINDIEGYHWGTPNAETYLNAKWRISYEGVVRANSAIRLLKSVLSANPGALSAADAHAIEGEALFLRAHYHFEAWRMWGNIPYYREDDADFSKANEPSAAVVTDLLKDLDSAIKLLPATPRNKGRAGQWTAKAYKGRVQVYAGQFAAGATTLREVMNSGFYNLETSYDRVWTGFTSAANGPETIWAFQASANDGEPNGNNSNWGERLNFPYEGSHFGCCGFNQPSQNLVNFFRVDAAGLPLALSAPGTWNANDNNFTAADLLPVDPRVDWTVGRDGVPFKDWGQYLCDPVPAQCIRDGWVRDPANGGPYGPKKNIHEKASGAESVSGWQPTQLNSVNVHLFRYADMLLLLAEADVETNNLGEALTIVNRIRARAAVAAQGPGTSATNIAVPINDPSITWAVYQVNPYPVFPDQAYARAAVRAERRLELAMEGQRFFDLRRWGLADAAAAINGYINGEGGGAEKSAARRLYKAGAEAFAQKHLLYPLPGIQIELSRVGGEQRLTQNPGW